MRFTILVSTVLAPLAVLAAPAEPHSRSDVLVALPIKPVPCVRVTTTEAQTATRAHDFALAFIYEKDISKAFKYISEDYINHHTGAENGFDFAWSLLSPKWASHTIKPMHTAFKYPQSWLKYQFDSFGEVVDRFRWEGGCIVEHWDQGEKFPGQHA